MSVQRLLSRIWTRDSHILLGGFILSIFLIVYIWWPLAEEYLAYIDWGGQWWLYIDWLLIGVFAFMSFTIIARANLRKDAVIIFVGLIGGLVIEAWGTQTNLWFYYTAERPPLWILPAWPIASLSIDRLARAMDYLITQLYSRAGAQKNKFINDLDPFKSLYWLTILSFLGLMLVFVSPTLDKPYTHISLLLCVFIAFTPANHRFTVLTFTAGSALGYFLELWGTTRACWTYYTHQTPPVFAVLAHGMAALAFWRTGLTLKFMAEKLRRFGLQTERTTSL